MLVELSNRIVQEFRASVGKGPSKCNAYWAGRDLLVVLLQGGYSVAEQTLFDAGHERAVHDAQHALQSSMEARLTNIVADLTGREVAGFLGASRQRPDLRAELFLLEPVETGACPTEPGSGSGARLAEPGNESSADPADPGHDIAKSGVALAEGALQS
ncbi:MAG TPA: Na-translocating system protein MpsC family protein [Solirubrobacteraceae bacterium]|jgi:uncharacterized protein YbcI|nr:Na-translocating system protein MpsC family protein [Solirubrobacteraceae bacterium]